MNMTWFKQKTVYLCMKRLYFAHASTLTVTIKAVLLSLILLFVVDDFCGCSHLLMVNSKLDIVERLYGTQHNVDVNCLNYTNELIIDMVNYKPNIVSFGQFLTTEKNSEERIQMIDTLTSALLPLFLMLLALWQLVRALFRKTVDQMERLINLALIVILLVSIVWLIASISCKLPTIAECPIINYLIYVIVNIVLYLLLRLILLKNYSQVSNQ